MNLNLLETNKLYSFKMSSGEEFIARVVAIDTNHKTLTVSEPLSIAPTQQGPTLVPTMFTTDQDNSVELNTSSVAMWAPTAESISSKYTEATTGITVPDKKIIMG